ncbi:uncharacterized protein LOC131040027 isoform X2 [Cryptomeria japonica]|uniref:uncharacterized protein LOC131040027 isoform X2 n=1 Tax=Cryptomeria japonica TaxID=3369 RepID=UPI0027DA139D|nr:uncharacterized protein LOC131040027 isoform X2 [Cryptomeria japonica]
MKSFVHDMEMPQKTFCASTSFNFLEPKEEHFWVRTGDYRDGPQFKRLKSVSQISLQSEPATAELTSNSKACSLNHKNQVSSMVTSACLMPTTALPQSSSSVHDSRPLGLCLRKSQSLVDLIQHNLNQNDQSSVLEQDLEENTKTKGAGAADSQQDKLKASNFPACYLKIGKWECSSVYEGDLVAKCYYAKRKLVWEVLDNGLKSKIEVQWSDITGLKANIPERGPASLHVEISRTPLFFRETNPQPRKHTLWQSTSDFTMGQASICRRHLVQFSEGVLNRHFEKLIQCDPRLKILSENTIPFSGSPFFEGQNFMLDMHRHHQYLYPGNISTSMALGSLPNEMLVPFNHSISPIVKQHNFHLIEQSDDRESTGVQPFSPNSEDTRRHAGYKKAGMSMIFDQSILYGDRQISTTMPHSAANVESSSMVSCSNLPQCKVPGGQVPLTTANATLSEQNFLQRLSNHLFEETIPENLQATGQRKEFPGKFTQVAEERVQDKKLLSGSASQLIRMTDTHIHDSSVSTYTLSFPENSSFLYPVKEEVKISESPFMPVKMETSISSDLNSIMFSPSGNSLLHGGRPDMRRQISFRDSLDSPQVPHL